jgi:hypothetical protein
MAPATRQPRPFLGSLRQALVNLGNAVHDPPSVSTGHLFGKRTCFIASVVPVFCFIN